MATVEKRGESYRIVASAGYDREGKQLRKRMTWTPAPGMTARQVEKELERQTVLFEERVKNGLFIEASIRFADYAELWLKNYGEKHLAPKTVSRYKALLVRINAAIGNIRLDRLQPHHISEFLDNLEEDGIKETASFLASVDLRAILKKRGMTRQALADAAGIGISTVYMTCRGKSVAKETAKAICKALNLKFKESFTAPEGSEKLSEKTVLHHYRLISAILNSAVIDDQILVTNPAARVRPPRCEHKEAEYLDEVQAAHLLDLLEGEPIQYSCIMRDFHHFGEWQRTALINGCRAVKDRRCFCGDAGVQVEREYLICIADDTEAGTRGFHGLIVAVMLTVQDDKFIWVALRIR